MPSRPGKKSSNGSAAAPTQGGLTVTFWGVRGSVATPGPDTALVGGNTSCVQVTCSDGTQIVLDCGTGIRPLGVQHMKERPEAPVSIIVTHHHWDHIEGLRFYTPLFVPGFRVDLYPIPAPAGEPQWHPLKQFNGTTFPLTESQLLGKIDVKPERAQKFRIGPATISRIKLNHPGGAQGIKVEENGVSVCYMTDDELNPPYPRASSVKDIAAFVRDTDLLIHDAQYVPEDYPAKHGWGHSLVSEVLELAHASHAKRLALFHHDPSRTDAQVAKLEKEAQTRLKERGFKGEVTAAREGVTVTLKK